MYKELITCSKCRYCNCIGNDDTLICINKKSEVYNKEISKYGVCELLVKNFSKGERE